MRKLLNTLYITNHNIYLGLDGETIVLRLDKKIIEKIPLHNLESIVIFGYKGISPALLLACCDHRVTIYFLNIYGKYIGHFIGKTQGNVLLRRQQYRLADHEDECMKIARNFILGKVYNSNIVLKRIVRDHPLRLNLECFIEKTDFIKSNYNDILNTVDIEQLRGIEGVCANAYFSLFDDMILRQKDDFYFSIRNRRPPLDNVNALLSFAYSLLASMCTSALECAGLDPYVGFLHKDRPGRASLALDLMEELRPIFADRFALKLINKQIIQREHFYTKENGAVLFTDEGRRIFLTHWEERKKDAIEHPFLKEKVEFGVLPFVQAQLLARYIRGDLDEYPPLFWR